MKNISSKALNGIGRNKEKTFQDQRFDDELGLGWLQFKYRNHDPQIGRFVEIDPLSDKYVYNSTYAFSENKVTSHIELEGLETADIKKPVDNSKVIDDHLKNVQIANDEDNYSDLEASRAGAIYNAKNVKTISSTTTFQFTSEEAVNQFRAGSAKINKATEAVIGAAIGVATGGVGGKVTQAALSIATGMAVDAGTGIKVHTGTTITVQSNWSLSLTTLSENNKLNMTTSITVTSGETGKVTYSLSVNKTLDLSNNDALDISIMKAVMNFPDKSARTIVNPQPNLLIRE